MARLQLHVHDAIVIKFGIYTRTFFRTLHRKREGALEGERCGPRKPSSMINMIVQTVLSDLTVTKESNRGRIYSRSM